MLGILVLFNLGHTVDDAFISFRYAENLVRGQGLVFNPGERVEGYTNFLWVILIAPCIALSIDPEVAAKVLGFMAAAGTLASSPPFVLWTTAGMETPLFTCLVAWSAVLVAEGLERGALPPSAGCLLGAAALTRPEGAGVAAVLAVLAGALGPRTPEYRRSLVRFFGAFLLIFIPYFAWRWWYYGQALPNTFYAKVGSGRIQMFRGLYYTLVFFATSGYWILLPFAGLRFCPRRRAALLLGGVTLALLGYTVYIGGDALPMFRFLVPLLPAFFLLLAMGASGLLQRFGAFRYARPAVLALLLVFAVGAARVGFTGLPYEDVQRDIKEVAAWKEVGAWFRANAYPDATIAVIPAGADGPLLLRGGVADARRAALPRRVRAPARQGGERILSLFRADQEAAGDRARLTARPPLQAEGESGS